MFRGYLQEVLRSFAGQRPGSSITLPHEEHQWEPIPADQGYLSTPGCFQENGEPVQRAFFLQSGFSSEEIDALFWLRQWYQQGGSDRAPVFYHLEFLRRLVISGRMEL